MLLLSLVLNNNTFLKRFSLAGLFKVVLYVLDIQIKYSEFAVQILSCIRPCKDVFSLDSMVTGGGGILGTVVREEMG